MIKMKIYGLGGQGVVTAAKILVQAVAIHEERYAKSLPAYGHERRGAPIFTDVMIGDEAILPNTFVYYPDIVVLFDQSVVSKGVDVTAGAHNNTKLVVNGNDHQASLLSEGWTDVFLVNASEIAVQKFCKNIPNSAMLGAIARTGIVGLTSIEQAIMNILPEKIAARNVAAAREAYEKTQII